MKTLQTLFFILLLGLVSSCLKEKTIKEVIPPIDTASAIIDTVAGSYRVFATSIYSELNSPATFDTLGFDTLKVIKIASDSFSISAYVFHLEPPSQSLNNSIYYFTGYRDSLVGIEYVSFFMVEDSIEVIEAEFPWQEWGLTVSYRGKRIEN